VALLEGAAAAGDADAMALLADEYETGLWVPQDAE
jgi:TPR repeat protein